MVTLSAAAAAQNLAIVLKARATTLVTTGTTTTITTASNSSIQDTVSSDSEVATLTSTTIVADNGKNIASSNSIDRERSQLQQEALLLYQHVLRVRQALQPADHPDLYVACAILAELLEYMGNTTAADQIRRQILDEYGKKSEQPLSDDAEGEEICTENESMTKT